MTLILTATCKDGIAVCSDKRRTVKTAQQITYTDNLQKTYQFGKVKVLAFNHGINRIRGKSWDDYLHDFELSIVHQGMPFADLVTAFRNFVDTPIQEELTANRFDDAVGFVFCACPQGSTPVVRELFWKKNVTIEDKLHRGLVRTGCGAHHLDQHLQVNSDVNSVQHWKELSVEDGFSELEALFAIACTARKQRGGQEFSDSFDKCKLDNQPAGATDGEDAAAEP